MLELSKQLVSIVKPMVHNELKFAQQHASMKDNSTLAMPWENVAEGNCLATKLAIQTSEHHVQATQCFRKPWIASGIHYSKW